MFRGSGVRVVEAPESEITVDELGRGRHIDVVDPELRGASLLRLEVDCGGVRTAEPQLKLTRRRVRPQLVEPDPELDAESAALGGVLTAVVLPPTAAVEPGQPRKRRGKLRPLPRLAREPDRLVEVGLRLWPAIAHRLVARKPVEQARQDADRGVLARDRDRTVDQPPSGRRIAEKDRGQRRPGESARIVVEVPGLVELDCPEQVGRAFASRHDARSSERHRGVERRLSLRSLLHEGGRPLGGGQHLVRRSRVERRIGRLGEHQHRVIGLRLRSCGDEELVPLEHRPAPGRDLAAQRHDLRIGCAQSGLVEQLARP